MVLPKIPIPEAGKFTMSSTRTPPVIIKDGIYKYRTPWWFCISVAWVIQKQDDFVQFLIQGHKVLSFKWNIFSFPLSGVYYIFPGVRIKWEIFLVGKEIRLLIEDHRVFTIDIEKLKEII